MLSERFLRPLFIAIALLQLVPVWSVHYLPTNDGACHLYNSWILREVVVRDAPGVIGSYYARDWRPHPNWIGHASMALLMSVVPPLVAEKILFSAIILVFLAGAWMLSGAVDPRGHVFAFLAFPFTFHLLLQTGFYNFSFGVGLFMITVAVWWKRRDRPDARTLAEVAALLLLCYFSHAMAAVLACLAIGVLWLVRVRRDTLRVQLRHAIAFLPLAALFVWFVLQRGTGTAPNERSLWSRLTYIARSEVVFTFDSRQYILGAFVSIVLGILIATTLLRRRAHNGFALVSLLFLILYIWSPGGVAGGTMITERMALFVVLSVVPWLDPPSRRAGAILVVVFSLIAVANAAFLVRRYRTFDRVIARFIRTLDPIAPGSTILPLVFDRGAGLVGYLSHAVDYAAIDKHLIDLDNYEPSTDYFPVKLRPGVELANIGEIEAKPEEIDVSAYVWRARYVMTWKIPQFSHVLVRLDPEYRLVHTNDEGRIYERRNAESAAMQMFQTSPQEFETVLLPFAGTKSDASTPNDVWRADQTVTNRGARPVHLIVTACAYTPGCEMDLQPGKSAPIAAQGTKRPYVLVRVRRGEARMLSFATVLRRGDFHVEFPAVFEKDLARRRVVFSDVPVSPRGRVSLRIWTFLSTRPVRYTVRVVGLDGRELAARNFATGPDGFQLDNDLIGEFPQLAGSNLRARIVVEFSDPTPAEARLWALLTVTDRATNLPTIYPPAR